jgi:recombination protein RecT
MTNALEKTKEQMKTVGEFLAANKKRIATVLPRHLDPDRMMRLALTSLQRNPGLLEATPASFIAAVIQSAQLGLEPDGLIGQAYLIPYRNKKRGTVEVNFQVGYQGLMDLGRRSGEISSIIPRVVHEKDVFEYHFGLDQDHLRHVPSEEAGPGKATYVYCIVRLKDGSVQYEVWPAAKVESHRRKHSRARDDGPWVTHWEEMAKKTLIIQVLKYCPKSVELAKAIALEEMV